MENLKKLIKNYKPYNKQEAKDKEMMLWYMEIFGKKSLSRRCILGHFTASVMLFNEEHTKVLMCYHLIDKSWEFLGGHADEEEDLRAVAIREVQEEAGIKKYHLINSGEIASLTCIPCAGHMKNGEYVPSHVHLDLAFVGEASEGEELIVKPDENNGLEWISIKEIENWVDDKWKMERVYRKLIERFGCF